jgi:D-arginine dehydrogenase
MVERTWVIVERIHSRWAGLRTFTPDKRPAVDFAIDAPGFFWLAGQGGFGLQTSPAMAAIVESMIVGTPWPVPEVEPAALLADRFVA